MMKTNHHLNDATLMAYVAGTLPVHVEFVVANHVAICAHCQEKVAELESVGGAALDNIDTVSMSAGALDNILACLDDEFFDDLPKPANDAGDKELPMPLRSYLPEGLDGVNWKTMAPGVKTYVIPGIGQGKSVARLLKIAPGVTIPEHSHKGSEVTMVLRGAFNDEIGRFKVGDIADLDDDNNHQPIADTHEACICLVAAEAPLRFKSMVPKIMQYFVGM